MLPIDYEGLGRMVQGNLEFIGHSSILAIIGRLDLADQSCR